MPIPARATPLILAAAMLTFAGCKDELGPEVRPTARVVGVVRSRSGPMPGGWIEFLPDGATVGDMCSAPIGRDGSFDAPRVPVGKVKIAFEGLDPDRMTRDFGPRTTRLFDLFRSTIRREVAPWDANRIDVDLNAELNARRGP